MSEINDLQNSEEAENNNTPNELVQNNSKDKAISNQDTKEQEPILTSKDSNDNSEEDALINEIDESNAKEAEDGYNKENDTVDEKDYSAMTLESLAIELEKLSANEKVQAFKKPIETINSEFKTKFQALVDEKKEEFINNGGNEIDFFYTSPVQKRFKEAYKTCRKKLTDHYKSLEKNLKQNLADKLEIIEELKSIINVEENINTTYKHFKELQERWRKTGPIPKDKYNNAWNSYHHHIEMFYDFLHLNRDLRDLDFKHNLEQKMLIILRAEELAENDDVIRAFRELQELHKMWKEELGPVGKEYRDEIWNRFKVATKKINDKRQIYYTELDKVHEKNLENKLEIIAKIDALNTEETKTHNDWQNKIKTIESLRKEFFNAGKVPIKVNEATWAKFKKSVRDFNRQKNAFYKELKKEQYENLNKKLELVKIAEDNKNSEDFEATTLLMKRIQSDWKKIGHVPRKDSDKIWKLFKNACNHYFERINSKKDAANKETLEAFKNKVSHIETLKEFKPSEDKEKDIAEIKESINEWKSLGQVPNDKRYIEGKFQKTIDDILSSLKMEKNAIEMIKFESKLDILSNSDDTKNLDNERSFIRKKIDETKSQINQLENNLQFFKNASDDNPLVKEVHNNIKSHKDSLKLWQSKLQKIKAFY